MMSMAVLLGCMSVMSAYAHPHHGSTVAIDNEIALETVTVPMIILKDSPKWVTISGTVSDPVDWYPVIIQVYKDDEPIHFAQTDLFGDDSYKYKFRIGGSDDSMMSGLFEGEYEVRVSAMTYHIQQVHNY